MPIITPPPYSAAVISQSMFQIVPDPRPSEEAAAKKIGVRITMNDVDSLPSPAKASNLARMCDVSSCVYYRRYCGEGGTYCGFAYGVAPQYATSVTLHAFQIKAKTKPLLDAALRAIGIPLGDVGIQVVHLSELAQIASDPNGCADPSVIIYDKPSCPSDMARIAATQHGR